MNTDYCEHHKPLDFGYLRWHAIAEKRVNQKYTQVFCNKCQRYLFPDELNEPENPASIHIIEKHKKYLEQHPKATSILTKGN
jgi:hypothetical protein